MYNGNITIVCKYDLSEAVSYVLTGDDESSMKTLSVGLN